MQKYILSILVLLLMATIGCTPTAVEKTKEGYLDRGDSHYRSGELTFFWRPFYFF